MKKALLPLCFLLIGVLSLQAADSVNVTFQVNMKVQALKDYFKPGTDSVTLPGDFDNWLNEPPANLTKVMSDPDKDSIYTKVVKIEKGKTYGYKYNIGFAWDGKDEPGDNRTLVAPTQDSTLNAVWFRNEAMPSGASANVTFEVNMKLPAKQDVNFSTKKVYVAGSFTDWGTSAVEMTDANTDSIYTVTTPINSGQLIQYKFITSASTAASGTWESIDNRKNFIVDGDQTITKNWDDKDPNVTLADGNVLFRIDMSVFQEIGIYDPDKDSLKLRSSFNGWSDTPGEENKWRMDQGVTNPLRWTLNVPFVQQATSSEYSFKYYLDLDTSKKAWTDPYERPAATAGGNRTVVFKGDASQQDSLKYYDDIKPDYVIPTGTSLQVKFRVDMRNASTATAGAFVKATDKVYWLSEMPSFIFSQGWVDSDTMKVLELTDADNDTIYEGTLTVKAPSFNTFLYRYAFVHGGVWGQESDGGPGHVNGYRLRFVGQNAAKSFPTNPWTMPLDTWDDSGTRTDQETDPYSSATYVRENNGVVVTNYELDQNYPNPFNPSTTIKFAIKTNEHVTLRVFNLLGQEVATLINEQLIPGSYRVKFDGKNMSSGMYLYRMTAGNYVETRKMLFLK